MDGDDDVGGGLFAISLSSDDETSKASKSNRRTDQTESEFQLIKDSYKVKIENGNIHENIPIPLPPDATKQQIQDVVHAVEELYFFRRFAEAVDFIDKVLSPGAGRSSNDDGDNDDDDDDGKGPWDGDTRRLLNSYRKRCWQKIE